MSPKLFTEVLEYAFKTINWKSNGTIVDGKRLNHLRFADDIVLISDNLLESREKLEELQNATQKTGLIINYNKTKMMMNLIPSEPIKVEKKEIEIVKKYNYLCYEIWISRNNRICELPRRIVLGWAAFEKLRDAFKEDIPINMKRKAFSQCVFPVLIYGTETSTLTKKSAIKLRITQRRMERSMLGLSLRDRIRNETIRSRTVVDEIILLLETPERT